MNKNNLVFENESADRRSLEDMLRQAFERGYVKGHVEGFVSSYEPNFENADNQLAKTINPYFVVCEQFLQERLGQELFFRFRCDSRNNRISFAVILPEEKYLESHDTLFSLISAMERILVDSFPSISNYTIESLVITNSSEAPLDQESVHRDFPLKPRNEH